MPLKRNRTRWDDALSRIDPTCFEALLADHYRAEGWSVEHVGADATGRAYDGGIDLKLRRGDEYVVVQCKRWNAMQVPHTDVHQLIGVMVTQRATGAVFVTCGEYMHAAVTAANRQPNLQLVDGAMVREWIDIAALEAELPSQTLKESGVTDGWSRALDAQDVTAQHADGATTLSRNCQLPEGQRAFLQRKRQVDVVAPEVRARFKDQQSEN